MDGVINKCVAKNLGANFGKPVQEPQRGGGMFIYWRWDVHLVSRAMEAGVAEQVWSLEEVIALLD